MAEEVDIWSFGWTGKGSDRIDEIRGIVETQYINRSIVRAQIDTMAGGDVLTIIDRSGKVDRFTLRPVLQPSVSSVVTEQLTERELPVGEHLARSETVWIDWLTVICPKKHRDEIMGEVAAWAERNASAPRFFRWSMVFIKAFQVMSVGLRLRVAGLIGLVAGVIRWIM